MTAKELLKEIGTRLSAAGCDSPVFDAACLIEDIGGVAHPEGDAEVSDGAAAAVRAAAEERAGGRPLQYILGHWDFLDMTLAVGEGVLIPRPDTECLCEVAAAWLTAHGGGEVLDLCAGSGCVGLGVAGLCRCPVSVTAVELSKDAFSFLLENIARYPERAVRAVRADVLTDAARFPDGFAAVLANPPYIPTDDLAGLMREVQCEPQMALDGDADGLRFYRAITEQWVPKLAPGGLCAVEVGIGQASAVATMFRDAGLQNVGIQNDLCGIGRVIFGEKP